MTADALLSRLDRVKKTGSGKWLACCPAHDDRSPSLSIRETDDGRILLHDFAGCAVEEILSAVGLTFDAIMPERAIDHEVKRERRPFNAHDVLACLSTEALIVAIAASHIVQGKPISDADKDRVFLASSRIDAARELING